MANKADRGDLLDELHRLDALTDATPKLKDLREHGNYSKQPFATEFGGWTDALRAAGLKPGASQRHGVEYPTLTCEQCGDSYQVKPAKEDRSRFCSHECLHAHKESWTGEKNPKPNAGQLVTIVCETCETKFEVIPAREDVARFCSYECIGRHHREVRSGEDSPHWKGGKAEYYGPNWWQSRERVLQRDGHTCQRCGLTREESLDRYNKGLDVHHITPLSEFETADGYDFETANDPENLIALCVSCHGIVEANGLDFDTEKAD